MKRFTLTNVAIYLKQNAFLKQKNEEVFEGVKKAAEKDGYHSFNNRDLVLLLIHRLEEVAPHRMKASTMLREVGLLNVFGDDDNMLMRVFEYCCGIILFLEREQLAEEFNTLLTESKVN